MKRRIPLTPLSAAERCFAAEHLGVIHQYLISQGLDADAWFDIVCFGYLQAVKKWHIRKDLHRYTFKTIAYQSMRSSVSNERSKQCRQIQTISLDQEIEGTDGLTLLDTVTRANLEFIYYVGGTNEY